MIKYGLKRWVGLGLAVSLGIASLAGCGSSAGSGDQNSDVSPVAAGEDGKGRYVENVLTMPFEADQGDSYTSILDMRTLTDGKLRLAVQTTSYTEEDYSTSALVFESEDKGTTWSQTMDLSELDVMKASGGENTNISIQNAAFSPEGDLFLIVSENSYEEVETDGVIRSSGYERYHYYVVGSDSKVTELAVDSEDLPAERTWDYEYSQEEEEGDSEEDETSEEDTDLSEDETSESEDDIQVYEGGEDGAQSEDSYKYISIIKYIDKDNIFLITDDGQIYHISVSKGGITGSEHDLDYAYNAAASGSRLILASWDNVISYDCESGKMTAEYPELLELINNSRGSITIADSTDESKIFYASNEGIFSYDMDSKEDVMIVDGKLTSMVSTDASINRFLVLPDNEFLICLENYSETNGAQMQLLHYTFDPDMPARPDKELTVYSLTDDYAVSQMCAMFQKSHPDVYVTTEFGMSGEDAVTSSDAVRTLNTRIMAGEGPDIIFLNGLPVDSYVEKGLLLDISDLVETKKQEGNVFETIIDTFKTKSGTFAVPITFSIPAMIARQDLFDQADTVSGLAQAAEDYTADSENKGSFIDAYSVLTLIATLMPSNAESWFNEDGSLDPDELKAYLTDIKRVIDSVKSTMSDEEKEQISSITSYLNDEEMQSLFSYSNFSGGDPSWGAVDVAAGNVQCALGNLGGSDGLQYMYSVSKMDSSIKYGPMPGNIKNVYNPGGIAGINAKTQDPESSKAFIDYILSVDVQKYMSGYNGFPVSKEAFDAAMVDPNIGNPGYEEGASYGSAGMVDDSGKERTLDLYWPDEKYIADFKAGFEDLTTAAYSDEMILTTILKDCIGCVLNDDDIDEAVDQVMKDINIYLSE